MATFRLLLLPFSLIYWFVIAIRNFLYDARMLKSYSFEQPVIVVGNLSVGGTGKTPQIEYLVRLLSAHYKVAVLSRGYKRKSRGFRIGDDTSTVETLGDEPFQYFRKFPHISVAVSEDRVAGIRSLNSLRPDTEVFLLDDAFQHRRLRAGYYILLTSYESPYASDLLLPAGDLREGSGGARRADVIVVTKCPQDLDVHKQRQFIDRLQPRRGQNVYFTYISYSSEITSRNEIASVAQLNQTPKLLVTGIANPKPFFDYLKKEGDDTLEFGDHHEFSNSDIDRILKTADGRMIVTTEKDFVRLDGRIPEQQLWYLPITTKFISEGESFDHEIRQYVERRDNGVHGRALG